MGGGTLNSEKSSDFVVAPELTKKGWSSRADVAKKREVKKPRAASRWREKMNLSSHTLERRVGAGGERPPRGPESPTTVSG